MNYKKRAGFIVAVLSLACIYFIYEKNNKDKNETASSNNIRNNVPFLNRTLQNFLIIDSLKIPKNYYQIKYIGNEKIIIYENQNTSYANIDLKNKSILEIGNKYSYGLGTLHDTTIAIHRKKENNSYWLHKYNSNQLINKIKIPQKTEINTTKIIDDSIVVLSITNEVDTQYYYQFINTNLKPTQIENLYITDILKNKYTIHNPFYFGVLFEGFCKKSGNKIIYKNKYSSLGIVYDYINKTSKIFTTIDSINMPELVFHEVFGGKISEVNNSIVSTEDLVVNNKFIINLSYPNKENEIQYLDFYDIDNQEYKYSLELKNIKSTIVSFDVNGNQIYLLTKDNSIIIIELDDNKYKS